MKLFLAVLLPFLAAGMVNANQNVFISDRSVFNLKEATCSPGDVLNCNGGADGHHVYEEEVKCPVGGEAFKAFYLGTHSTYGRHLDWEPVSYMRFPVPIPVCPSNGFVVAKKDHSKEELQTLKAVVDSKPYKDLYAQKHATSPCD